MQQTVGHDSMICMMPYLWFCNKFKILFLVYVFWNFICNFTFICIDEKVDLHIPKLTCIFFFLSSHCFVWSTLFHEGWWRDCLKCPRQNNKDEDAGMRESWKFKRNYFVVFLYIFQRAKWSGCTKRDTKLKMSNFWKWGLLSHKYEWKMLKSFYV